ncbi:MFS transporter [Pilimelia terevasa]|uniref:MFS transporter n=1 Tax=Pilimelia terevasa TaxID=53372 RepID=A0A8J3BU44_9ACTN|nr:MFS transporter [Pilimelia terevasa]GGK42032.1 MFS transporter [Pilimelia terevasa]
MAMHDTAARPPRALRKALLPLALAQFICSFAGSNMNVMIKDISRDLGTTVPGVQLAITIFLLVMAALMIPGGKLTDRYGRKRCLTAGLVIYGVGTLVSVVAPGLPVLILGNSILQGVGTALLIPPVYILTTLLFTDIPARARAFGAISAMGGIGAAAGPLIGGLITSALSWRAAFAFQALIIVVIIALSRRYVRDPLPADPDRPFDTGGAVLSALGLLLVVTGILAVDDNGWLAAALAGCGVGVLALFVAWVRARERAGREALLSTALLRSRTSNLGMVTQNVQWLMLMGTSFVIAAYLQVVLGYSAIATGLVTTAATAGLLLASLAAERLAKRRPQRTLIVAGFATTIGGIAALLLLAAAWSGVGALLPGLFLIGLGIGAMLTPSVNVVQSSFGEQLQGEISGLSRSVSNLGSSLGAALASTIILAAATSSPGTAYAVAMVAVGAVGLVGLGAALLLPRPAAAPDTR